MAKELEEQAVLSLDVVFSGGLMTSVTLLIGLSLFIIAIILIFFDVKKTPTIIATIAVVFLVVSGFSFLFNIDIVSNAEPPVKEETLIVESESEVIQENTE